MLDVEALGAVVAPGNAGEPVQVVPRDIELRGGRLQGGQLAQLLLDHSSSILRDGVLERLHLVPEAAIHCKPGIDCTRTRLTCTANSIIQSRSELRVSVLKMVSSSNQGVLHLILGSALAFSTRKRRLDCHEGARMHGIHVNLTAATWSDSSEVNCQPSERMSKTAEALTTNSCIQKSASKLAQLLLNNMAVVFKRCIQNSLIGSCKLPVKLVRWQTLKLDRSSSTVGMECKLQIATPRQRSELTQIHVHQGANEKTVFCQCARSMWRDIFESHTIQEG